MYDGFFVLVDFAENGFAQHRRNRFVTLDNQRRIASAKRFQVRDSFVVLQLRGVVDLLPVSKTKHG